MACLSALLPIGSSSAYMLFDSGSNTDPITPEYAHATDSPRIRLEEQVTLQLGCVGSRSKISYGTRAPFDLGGIKGHLYLDQVNLDRYDGIIEMPFMNRHGLVLDFGHREVRFPNGKVIPALSGPEEVSILIQRQGRPRAPGAAKDASPAQNSLASGYVAPRAERSPRASVEEIDDEDDAELDFIDGVLHASDEDELRNLHEEYDDSDTESSFDDEDNSLHVFDDLFALEETPVRIRLRVHQSSRGVFVSDPRHPSSQHMHGLRGADIISPHSFSQAIHWTGEDDRHGLCDEALEEAETIIGLCSA
ncbi:hypothetical protein B0H11DRAFT_2223623 [Mycena galericulata]|nr:hypothetical protein B0H11DRAFT_2223623 [Mycena galericulata]